MAGEKGCWEELLRRPAEKGCWKRWWESFKTLRFFFTHGRFGGSRWETKLESKNASSPGAPHKSCLNLIAEASANSACTTWQPCGHCSHKCSLLRSLFAKFCMAYRNWQRCSGSHPNCILKVSAWRALRHTSALDNCGSPLQHVRHFAARLGEVLLH